MSAPPSVAALVRAFAIDGRPLGIEPLGHGHIHQTWCSRIEGPAGIERYVHQRINLDVFPRPEWVMENIERITSHLERRFRERGVDPVRRVLRIVRTRDGATYHRTPDGEYWRCYVHIDHAVAYVRPRDVDHVYQVGRAFGEFVRLLDDLDGPPLHETIPGFADLPSRYRAFARVVERDPAGRVAGVAVEIEFARRRESMASLIDELVGSGASPERRAVHHDTKIDNVLIDDRTGQAVCVIDLDTVMSGSPLFDFGDAVRFAASRTPEDEPDPRSVRIEPELFEALAHGYLDATVGWLTVEETERLVDAALTLTWVAGLRFLTDHLDGDRYFGVSRPGQNLDRARVQFGLVESIERESARMRAVVERWRRSGSRQKK